jgi:hypothetical protein
VWQVTESNRNEMPGRVMEWIEVDSDPHSGGPFPPR